MTSLERVLLVVPALNEERSVGSVVNAGRGLGYDVCVVDDGSRDRTAQIAAGAGARVLRLPVNLGVGGALRCGFRWALDHGYDVVVQVDADGQHDPRQVNVLLDALRDSGADMIVGSRFAARDGHYRVSLARQIAMKILSARVRRVAGVHVIDSKTPAFARYAAHCSIDLQRIIRLST